MTLILNTSASCVDRMAGDRLQYTFYASKQNFGTPMSFDVKSLDIERVHDAFSPAQEIRDPELFAGRQDEIKKAVTALMNKGGFLTIYGLRGVGKSSIAQQIKLIAEGDKTLPKIQGIDRLLPGRGFEFLVHYIRCDGFVKNIPDLLKRILFGDDENDSLFSHTKAGDQQMVEFKKTLEASASIGIGGGGGRSEKLYRPRVSDDLIQQFRQLLRLVRRDTQTTHNGLLILVDEFDTISDKAGFASIVKACSSEFVKFGVVGIATTVSELISDHNSIGRQLDYIKVERMQSQELHHILKKAEFKVGKAIKFSEEAAQEICSKSEGFPHFTHLLGREAMLIAFQRRSSHVTKQDIQELAQAISKGRLNTSYDEVYHSAIKQSEHREILLKLFAEVESEEIHTEGVYANAKGMGLSNPSQLMKELTAPDEGAAVLTKIRDRYYRFSDPVFKAYARMRQWKF